MLRFLIVIVLLEKALSSSLPSQPIIDFDKNYVGVVYEPYTKYHDDRLDYTIDDVQDMLLVVAKRFKRISTYAMGTINSTNNWNEGQAGGVLPGVAASNINKKMNALELIVNLGTWYNSNDQIMNREIANAFSVAEVANNNFMGTVNGIIITSHHTCSDDQLSRVVQLLKENFIKARNMSVQLGVRSSNCDALSHSELGRELISLIDFINCQKLPTTTAQNASTQVRLVGEYLLQIQKELVSVKPKLIVIGETGWPFVTNGQRDYSRPVKFWLEMGEWARINKFRVDMFTAFDEPWKISIASHEPHFGWWKRVKNDSSDHEAFVEKFACIDFEPEPTEDLKISHTSEIPAALGTILTVVTAIIVSTILGICIAVFIRQKKNKKKTSLTSSSDANQLHPISPELELLLHPSHQIIPLPSPWIANPSLICLSLLGEGFFGKVYKVEDRSAIAPTTRYAIKCVDMIKTLGGCSGPSSASNTSTTPSLESSGIIINLQNYMTILLNEIEIMDQLSCDHVVRYYGCWAEAEDCSQILLSKSRLEIYIYELIEHCNNAMSSGQSSPLSHIFIRMELCHTTLKHYLQVCSEEEVVGDEIRIIQQIATGLHYVHTKLYIHRDIKPGNIFCKVESTGNLTWKIGDFGLAVMSREDGNVGAAGTYLYQSPEIRNELKYTVKTDLYSLGLVGVEILHKERKNLNRFAVFSDLRGLSGIKRRNYLNNCSKGKFKKVINIVSKMLHVDPDKRICSEELCNFLNLLCLNLNTNETRN